MNLILAAGSSVQGRSRFGGFDFDMVRYFGFDIASILRAQKPMLDRVSCYVNVSVSICTPPWVIEAQPVVYRAQFGHPPKSCVVALLHAFVASVVAGNVIRTRFAQVRIWKLGSSNPSEHAPTI